MAFKQVSHKNMSLGR